MPGPAIDDMFAALRPAAEQVASAIGCDVLEAIFSEVAGYAELGQPSLAATREEATRNAESLSDTLALTYCPGFGATEFKLVKGGQFTGFVGYHRDGTPLACIIRGFSEVVIGGNGIKESGYLSIASVYSLVPKNALR